MSMTLAIVASNMLQYDYSANKADYIKDVCDVLIEDDISNVIACNAAGLPTLLIDRPHN